MTLLATSPINKELILEVSKRNRLIDGLRDTLFAEQLAFIDDPSKTKAAQCSRRAGKSYGAGAYFTIEAIKYPRSTCLYIATTRDQARKIMFKDVLKVINRNFRIGMKFNETNLNVTYPNGSMLYLMGTDSSPEEADKALGQKYRLVIIDESASYRTDQRHLVHAVLQPATADLQGTICLIGSCGNNTSTLFFDVTHRKPPDPKAAVGWSVHKWDWRHNPHTCKQMQNIVDTLINNNPLVVETPFFKQMYMNQWVVDPSALVYKYTDERNWASGLPREHQYYYTLSVDLGYEDDTAFTVAAYSSTDRNMYFVEALKRKHMDITDVANVCNMYRQKYNPVKWIIDGSQKQAVVELNKRYGFPFHPANRQGKTDMIALLNADLIQGHVKALPAAQALVDEWKSHLWKQNTVDREESNHTPNHCCDSALYNWRECYHYAATIPKKPVERGSKEEVEQWWEKEGQRIIRSKRDPQYLRDFAKEYGFDAPGRGSSLFPRY